VSYWSGKASESLPEKNDLIRDSERRQEEPDSQRRPDESAP
jgi:hypothetical protein